MPVSAKQIREVLHRIVPKRVSWSSRDIWNIRLSAMKYRKSLSSQNDFDTNAVPNMDSIIANPMPDSLDNHVDDILDPALKISDNLFRETLKHSIDHEYSRFMVGTFMKKLQQD